MKLLYLCSSSSENRLHSKCCLPVPALVLCLLYDQLHTESEVTFVFICKGRISLSFLMCLTFEEAKHWSAQPKLTVLFQVSRLSSPHPYGTIVSAAQTSSVIFSQIRARGVCVH